MNAIKEKRSNPRHPCHLKAKCAQFVRSPFYGADVLNISKGGLFLETKLPLKPGVAMLVREILPSSNGDCEGEACRYSRTAAVGEVTRCHELISPDGRLTYGIGLKILQPTV